MGKERESESGLADKFSFKLNNIKDQSCCNPIIS